MYKVVDMVVYFGLDVESLKDEIREMLPIVRLGRVLESHRVRNWLDSHFWADD